MKALHTTHTTKSIVTYMELCSESKQSAWNLEGQKHECITHQINIFRVISNLFFNTFLFNISIYGIQITSLNQMGALHRKKYVIQFWKFINPLYNFCLFNVIPVSCVYVD